MKIKTLSFLSVLLVAVAIVQAAPTPVKEAPKTIPFRGENTDDPNDVMLDEAILDPEDEPLHKAGDLSCRDEFYNGRQYGITCDGSEWYIWVLCTNSEFSKRYYTGPISGSYAAAITCPYGA